MFWQTQCWQVGRLKSEERSRYACFSILRKALVFMVTEPCVFVLSACVVIDIGMVDQCIMYAFFRKIQVVIMGLLKLDDDDHCSILLELCTGFTSVHLFPVDFWIMHRGYILCFDGNNDSRGIHCYKAILSRAPLKSDPFSGSPGHQHKWWFVGYIWIHDFKECLKPTRTLARFANMFRLTH